MAKNNLVNKYFEIVLKERLWSNLPFYLDFIFKDVTFDNKAMLDIGGGKGLFSFYAGCMGANKVICLEPEMEGSDTIVREIFDRIQVDLEMEDKVIFDSTPIENFQPNQGKFDIILLHNSINHLDEEACIKLKHNKNARTIYNNKFKKLSDLANKGAKLVIVDSSRHNIFPLLKIKNPFAPSIEWEKHQHPKYWSKLLNDAGFFNSKIRWISPNRLGQLGRLVLTNGFVSYFIDSYFCLTMEKG